MTRDEFWDSISSWGELKDFCYDNICEHLLEDVYDENARNEAIDNEMSDQIGNLTWQEFRDWLDDIPDDSYWYSRNEWDGTWRGLDDWEDLDNAKQEVSDWIEENCGWEAEEEEAPYEDPYDETPTEKEDLSIIDLMMSGSAVVEAVRRAGASEETIAEIEKNFADSISEMIEKGA